MADAPAATAPKFAKTKPPAGKPADDTPTLHLSLDPLESIYAYVDELAEPAKAGILKKQGGSVTFVTQSGFKLPVRLLKTWFPAGTWGISIDGAGSISAFAPLSPKDVPKEVIDAINKHSGPKDFLLQWQQNKDEEKAIKNMIASAAGRTIRLVVSYSRNKGGNPKSLPDKLALTAGDIAPLQDPRLAELYLQFVEHFGGIKPDFNLAKDGLTREEVKQVEQDRPEIIAITDLFLQGFAEFSQAKDAAEPPAGLDDFRSMEEAIFFQKKVNNDLARRNMLMIAMGNLLFTAADGRKDVKPDIGVIRRTVNGGSRMILYDRRGNAVRGIIGGFLDTEFRSTDLSKIKRDTGIPFFTVEVEDQALYAFLRGIEQNLGQPIRELEALAASYYKYSIFINAEIHRRYNGEIGKRFIACAPIVIMFFVAHAFAAYLVTVQPAVGLALMALIKGAGLVLGFDALLLDMGLLMQAGRHFTQMEQLSREEPGKDPELTKLSQSHLHAGAAALLDAMADLFVLGVLIVGPFAIAKAGPALVRGIQNQAKARVRLTVENDTAVKIEPVEPVKEVKTAEPKAEPGATKGGLEAKEPQPGAGDPQGKRPIEHPDAYQGKPLEGKTPKPPPPIEQKRPQALDQSPEEFAKDTPAQKAVQKELFDAAKEAVARENAFIKQLLSELGIKDAEAESILKRDELGEFTTKIIDKISGRKAYKTVSEMTDIIRGRVNLENPADVERVVKAIMALGEGRVKSVKEPAARVGVEDGYPRFHIDVIDPKSGMVHEWQIGTKQTTRLFQEPGIDPAKLDIKPENTNIHDIEYDIFKSIDEPGSKRTAAEKAEFKALSEEFGIGKFRRKVAELAARTGREKVPEQELAKRIKELHDEAGKILQGLVGKKGKDFVQDFLH